VYAKNRGDCFAILDAPLADDTTEELVDFHDNELLIDSSYSALYAPWIRINNPGVSGNKIEFPPSADVAGKYVEVILRRGLQKAPANEVLDDVLGLVKEFDDADQDILNPKGINVIRIFPGEGIRIFGARTLLSRENGFHYVNIRKQFNFIKSSLKASMRSRVFEPNTSALQEDIFETVTSFFESLIPSGFFATTDPSTAFFVKCDAETNPPEVVNRGQVICKIGVNLPRPAEQIEFTMYLSQQNGVEFAAAA
jgi:phage tail sheath protein FI